jgi:hypothetical protein
VPLSSDKWWLNGLSKQDIENMAQIGQDVEEEPVIYD